MGCYACPESAVRLIAGGSIERVSSAECGELILGVVFGDDVGRCLTCGGRLVEAPSTACEAGARGQPRGYTGGVDQAVATESGRTLLVFDSGQGEVPILSIHGSGMGRIVYPPYLEMATGRGARVLSYDRPGLGGSTRRPGYHLSDCATDVRAIAAALGLERLLVWGISGGGPFALACAALLPDLVVAVAELGGVSPPAPDGQPKILKDPEASREDIGKEAAKQREMDWLGWTEEMRDSLPSVDVDTLRRGAADWFAVDARDAFVPGGDGWFDEQWAVAQDWGFDLGNIRVPVLIVHGLADPGVPPIRARELAARIPGAELRLLEGVGHFSLLDQLDEVVDWLLARF
jgi:pimeloyl-ACP methyl ester carboxylesterase